MHEAYPHRPDQGCNPDLWELGLGRGKSGEGRRGDPHADNSCRLFPGTDVCSQEAVQEFPPQDSPSLPLTRTLPHPGMALARAAPRSSREAQLTQGTPP